MQFKSEPATEGGSGIFLRLKDKESVTGVFRGDLHEFSTLWKDGKSQVVPDGTPKASFRFRINFILSENGAMVSKIWEQGATNYHKLKELHDEYNLEKTYVKITRHGRGLDTEYSILPLVKQQVTPMIEKKIAAVGLQELKHEDAPQVMAPPSTDNDEEIPF